MNHDTQLRADVLKAKIDFLDSCRQRATGVSRSGYDVRISKLRNVYLRSMGEIQGVRATGLVAQKRAEDLRLRQWIDSGPRRQQRYGARLIDRMDSVYARVTVYNHMDEAFDQLVGSGAGIIPFAGKFEKLIAIDVAKRKTRARDMAREIAAIQRNVREFFPVYQYGRGLRHDEDRATLLPTGSTSGPAATGTAPARGHGQAVRHVFADRQCPSGTFLN